MSYPTVPLKTRAFLPLIKWPDAGAGFGCSSTGSANCAASGVGELFCTAGKPFFHILTDNGIANMFLEAVASNPEEARAFISKHYVNMIDLDALRDVLVNTSHNQLDDLDDQLNNRLCKSLVQATYSSDPKNCQTHSVLVVDTERNIKRLLHLHMVKEPDRYGQWKIYGVEQE